MTGRKLGHIVTQETRDKIRRSLTGKTHSLGTRQKMKESAKNAENSGRFTKESYEAGKLKPYAHWTGKEMSIQTKEKMSIAQKAKPNAGRFKTGDPGFWLGKKRPNMSGSNAPNWKGGITTELLKRVHDPAWRALTKVIYERDNWTCQVCGKHCRDDIQCHHIIPVKEDGSDDAENLVTLCRAHHLKVERSKYQDFWRCYLSKAIKISLN